jgi:uncharacterized YkwD family protein
MRRSGLSALLLILLLIRPAWADEPPACLRDWERETLRLVNQERGKQGLTALTPSPQLTELARVKAEDMVNAGYFAHRSPTYGSPFAVLRGAGVRYAAAGENLARGYHSPAAAVAAWMDSPAHRDNLLCPAYRETGVGVARKDNGTVYIAQWFTAASAAPPDGGPARPESS